MSTGIPQEIMRDAGEGVLTVMEHILRVTEILTSLQSLVVALKKKKACLLRQSTHRYAGTLSRWWA